ncbi:UNVERIFIED_ORG: hypothetical protein ABIB52_004706 [Arthrobacter sp. UYCu721]
MHRLQSPARGNAVCVGSVLPHDLRLTGAPGWARDYNLTVFNIGQRTAVMGAFSLAGYEGPIRTLPVISEDERIFVLGRADLGQLREVRTLEQIVGQLLGRKVAIIESGPGSLESVPFT